MVYQHSSDECLSKIIEKTISVLRLCDTLMLVDVFKVSETNAFEFMN